MDINFFNPLNKGRKLLSQIQPKKNSAQNQEKKQPHK